MFLDRFHSSVIRHASFDQEKTSIRTPSNMLNSLASVIPWSRPVQRGDAWFYAGRASTFPNITEAGTILSDLQPPCATDSRRLRGCRVFQVPQGALSNASEVSQEDDSSQDASTTEGDALEGQVLIFRYQGKFHAVDNRCPHSSFPLSRGSPFDIEDFGVVLSSGLVCAKHGWAFDLFSGRADRSNYRLKLWEIELRDVKSEDDGAVENGAKKHDAGDKEVWVRRKQRIG